MMRAKADKAGRDLRFDYVPIDSYEKRALCECGGELQSCGGRLRTNPALYLHRCKGCDKRYQLDTIYPRVIHRERKI